MANDGDVQKHTGKPLEGAQRKRGADFDPNVVMEAGPGIAEVNRPRPAKTRFPIDPETFVALKQQAAQAGAITAIKETAALALDRGKKKIELASLEAAPLLLLALPEAAAAPTAAFNFGGIPNTGWFPPDCTLAAGPQHVLASVNSSIAIYAKTGGAPVVQRTLTTWFQNVVSNAKIFDPKALYDQHVGRWVLIAVALPAEPTVQKSWFLVSVSKTADPLGGWWNYALDATKDGSTATSNWADYPALGVDHQALYLTANMFRFGGSFAYAKIRVIAKTGLYSGGTVKWTDHVKLKNADGSMAFTVQPCHTYGAPQIQYFINSLYPTGNQPTPNRLSLWSLSSPLSAPKLIRRTVSTDPYGLPPDADQKGGGTPLDTGDVRMLNAVFRGGSVYAALTTLHNWGDNVNVAAVHWFQVNATSGALVQQGIYGAKGLHYFYPAIMPDANGNVTVVFCRCGANEFVSVYYTGRVSSDPLGQLQPSALLKIGTANYRQLDGFGRNRWGDYAGISTDPTDGRLIWFYSGYASALNAWGTWVGSARF